MVWEEDQKITQTMRKILIVCVLFFLAMAYFLEPTMFEYRNGFLVATILSGAMSIGFWVAKIKFNSQDFSALPKEIQNKSEAALRQIAVAVSALQIVTVASILLMFMPTKMNALTLTSTASLLSYAFAVLMIPSSIYLVYLERKLVKTYFNN
jgi:energy-coupling factor transporter transmembrane protein EcfT